MPWNLFLFALSWCLSIPWWNRLSVSSFLWVTLAGAFHYMEENNLTVVDPYNSLEWPHSGTSFLEDKVARIAILPHFPSSLPPSMSIHTYEDVLSSETVMICFPIILWSFSLHYGASSKINKTWENKGVRKIMCWVALKLLDTALPLILFPTTTFMLRSHDVPCKTCVEMKVQRSKTFIQRYTVSSGINIQTQVFLTPNLIIFLLRGIF